MLVVLCDRPVNLLIVVNLDLSGIVMATDVQQHQLFINKKQPSSSSLCWLLDNLILSTKTTQPQDHNSALYLYSSKKRVTAPNMVFKKTLSNVFIFYFNQMIISPKCY